MKNMRIILAVIFAVVASLTAVGQTKKVAILETVDRVGGISYGIRLMIRSELSSAITKTPGFEGYSRTDIDKVMSEHDFQRTGLVNDEQIKQLGVISGAQYILIAETAKIDDYNMYITASIINIETAKLEKTSNIHTGTEASQLKNSCESLAKELFATAYIVDNTVAEQQETVAVQEASEDVVLEDMTPDQLYKKGYELFVRRVYDKAIVLLDQAAQQGHSDAQYSLGLCYKNGLGTCKDIDIAILWVEKAAKQGNKEAKKMLRAMKSERFWNAGNANSKNSKNANWNAGNANSKNSKNANANCIDNIQFDYNAGNMYMQPNNRGASLNFNFKR